ncbi:MAG: RDD family protein [Xanthomonadales bacterium]|nr:RDD family protein [Xanthomonadales bacterium]
MTAAASGPEKERVEFIGVMFRLTALIVDQLLILLLASLLGAALFAGQLQALQELENPQDIDPREVQLLVQTFFVVVLVPLHVLWHVFGWGLAGATPGDWLLSSRVVAFADGGRPGVGRSLLRYLSAWPSALLCGIGFFMLLRNPYRRAWYDRLSGTAVIGDDSLRAPSPQELELDHFNIHRPPWIHG